MEEGFRSKNVYMDAQSYSEFSLFSSRLFSWAFDLIIGNLLHDVHGWLIVNSATDSEASSQDLLNGTLELPGLTLETHLTSNIEDGIHRDITTVGDVLDLLAITWWLLKLLDHQTGGLIAPCKTCLQPMNRWTSSNRSAISTSYHVPLHTSLGSSVSIFTPSAIRCFQRVVCYKGPVS